MASKNDTGKLTYYINGEPITGIYGTIDTGKLTNYINGEPLTTLFPVSSKKLGQYFLMFN